MESSYEVILYFGGISLNLSQYSFSNPFLLINVYTASLSHTSLNNILSLTFNNSNIETGEIGLPVTENDLTLPCGIYGKVWKD